jgi:hypothetical protein
MFGIQNGTVPNLAAAYAERFEERLDSLNRESRNPALVVAPVRQAQIRKQLRLRESKNF